MGTEHYAAAASRRPVFFLEKTDFLTESGARMVKDFAGRVCAASLGTPGESPGTSGPAISVTAAKTMKRYLLPCECSERIAVTAGQAGDEVQCPVCRRRRAVPRLGDLAALEQAPAEPPSRRQWTVGHAWSLAGLLVSAAAVSAAVGLRPWAVGTPPALDTEIRAAVAGSDIATVHRAYRDMARSGVYRPPLPDEARNQRIARSAEAFSWLLWGIAAGGAAVAAIAFGLASGPRQRVVDDG